MGKKPNVSVTYENERISITNSFPYTKCVMHLLCGPWADLWLSHHLIMALKVALMVRLMAIYLQW